MRTSHDARRVRADLVDASRVVIVSAGHIGLECAATLNKCGKRVTVVEAGTVS